MRFKLKKYPSGIILEAHIFTDEGDLRQIINVLTFKKNGQIHRSTGIPNNIGFQVDDIGRILINDREG